MCGVQVGLSEVSARLGLGHEYAGWLADLEAAGSPPDPTPQYTQGDTEKRLREFGLSAQDAAEAAAVAPHPQRDPELWWLLERCRRLLALGMGTLGPDWYWPSLPVTLGERGRWFFVHVFLSAAPAVREWNQAHGIPDDVVSATLADLGEKVGLHRLIHGVGGFDKQAWLTLHLRGAIHRLGALQFERVNLGGESVPGVKGPALSVHIPAAGPLTPEACDESLRLARAFFPAYFPEWPCERAVCISWLLDPQLAEYLAPESNIMRFQHRFQLAPLGDGDSAGDRAILEFVFRKIDPTLDDLPQRTTLERAVVDHLRAGRHWRVHPGWFPLN